MFVNAGSRYESIEESGSAALLWQTLLRSPEFQKAVNRLGAKVHLHEDREVLGVTLGVLNEDVEEAVRVLLKHVSRDVEITEEMLNVEREVLHTRNLEVQRDQFEQTYSCLYETTFRDHQMGQPILGMRDNAKNLTAEMVNRHRDRTFLGSNVALVISGRVQNSDKVLDVASESLSKWPSQGSIANNDIQMKNLERPYLTSSTIAVRDDEMANLNIAASYYTPRYGSEESLAYKFFESMIGDYHANENGVAHLNNSDRQYNMAHSWLGDMPGINIFMTRYQPYSDHGVFSTFIHGNEVWGNISLYLGQFFGAEYAKSVNQADAFRARARLFNDLLNNSKVSVANNLSIGRDLLYLRNRVSRSELASRYSAMTDPSHLQKRAKEFFYDVDISCAFYGPMHAIENVAFFDRTMRKSTLWGQQVRIHYTTM